MNAILTCVMEVAEATLRLDPRTTSRGASSSSMTAATTDSYGRTRSEKREARSESGGRSVWRAEKGRERQASIRDRA